MAATLQHLIRRYAPWFAIDFPLVIVSFCLAFLLAFIGGTPVYYLEALQNYVLFIAFVYCFVNYLFGIYRCVWRYASAQEVACIFASAVLSTLLLAIIDMLWLSPPLPIGVVFLGGFFTLAGFTAVRYRWRLVTGFILRWRALWGYWPAPCTRVLIVGAGEAGQLLAWQLLNQNPGQEYYVVGFIDDDPNKLGMQIHGVKILGNRWRIPAIVAEKNIDLIIIAYHTISGQDFRDILSICQQTTAQIKVLPNVFETISKRNGALPIREITVEDLLGRKPVPIDEEVCQQLFLDKVVLVTGASGSIGAELCRQIARYNPKLLLMLDNNETGLHNLNIELLASSNPPPLQLVLGDITNEAKMNAIFARYCPQIIFHSAAYKHVHLMEEHPDEAVRVNILGTLILSALAQRYGAERFVFISTDKAVNPSNVMGATKRVGELLLTTMPTNASTLYTAVRFGNVLGSRGSVVPTFWKQIELGGPVTVTHPEMTRFFMSIPEAVSLIIQAASLTHGGDIFVLDMGEQIRIVDLAKRMIRLRGLRVGTDIEIVYIGMRPGEKLHEELVGQDEEKYPTSHPRIFRVHNNRYVDRNALLRQASELIRLAQDQNNGEVVAKLQEMAGMHRLKMEAEPEPLSYVSKSWMLSLTQVVE